MEIRPALGADALSVSDCPPDYTPSNVSLVLMGGEVDDRRPAYVFELTRLAIPDGAAESADAGSEEAARAEVIVASEHGCRRGAPAHPHALASAVGEALGE